MESELSVQDAYTSALQKLASKNIPNSTLGEVVELLTKIRDTGVNSPQLESNLGKAYGRLDNWPAAVEHLENSVHMDRWNSSYREDLRLAQEKIQGGLGTPMSHPAEWGYLIASYARTEELLTASSALLWIFLFYWYRVRTLKAKMWIPSVLLIVAMFGATIFSLSADNLAILDSKSEVTLHSAPLENSEVIAQLKAGTRLRVLRESGNYSEVERPNVFRGWTLSSSLKKLEF